MSMDREFQVLEESIKAAGTAVYKMAQEGFETAHKANQDPVTTADLEADRLLREALLGQCPDTGWLSEETRDNPDRLKCERVWIVDPVDGTKEFVTGIPEFAVSAALVARGEPVLAGVYNPATDELFMAAKGAGATLNGEPIQTRRPLADPPLILASRSEIKRGEWEVFEAAAELKVCGSIAYKMALVAAQRADATFSLGPKNEWDIAAGALLVAETGGYVADKEGRPYVFNQADTLVTSIVATTSAARQHVLDLISSKTR